ncbi:MAG: hypothetical protein LBR52_07210 [Prevotellaceae bacterium]|jgi:hypothetical protein|nr:hypothetical protein [Prevotellaceae bacterium]
MKTFVKNFIGTILFAFISISLICCSKDDEMAPARVNTRAADITVSGVITGTNNWSGTVYLDGKVFVVNGTLTIAPGTVIIGKAKATAAEASALIITKTGKIYAEGTMSNPVIFKGESNTKGSWGGIVILGTGAINQPTAQVIEGITSAQAAGNDVTYGTPARNLPQSQIDAFNNTSSGTLRYVRVEYAGAAIAPDNELNAFTFGGVGSGTVLENLQAYYGADDAFEFFGGAANAKYLISTATDDDAFDFDFGYQGKLQFLVAVLDPNGSYSANANGIECDNNATGEQVAPYTRPVISNLTVAGTANGSANGGTVLYGAQFRRASQFVLCNSIIYGYNTCIDYNGTGSYCMANNVIGLISGAIPYNPANPVRINCSEVDATLMKLAAPFAYAGFFTNGRALNPIALPASSGANFSDCLNNDPFFIQVTYKGALNSANYWITGPWVNKVFPN